MPTILHWFLRLVPANPICVRLVAGGSRRLRHLTIRSGYLAVIIVVMMGVLLAVFVDRSAPSLRSLASSGATIFEWVSILQVALICLLTPIFMAGAIAEEANPRTWDILLTTPLSALQVVLGNLFGRLFFVLALLFSSLPLFAVIQFFGGVPGESIFASYAIAGTSSLLVAAIAVTLCVTRTAGRRAVFFFYACVIMYLFATFAIDRQAGWREPVTPGSPTEWTTVLTPLNPFLALEVLLQSNTYMPREFTDAEASWLTRTWLGSPVAAFCWSCVVASLGLILASTLQVRRFARSGHRVPWLQRMLGVVGVDSQRAARPVGQNPIAWREATSRGRTLPSLLGRWGFAGLGLAAGGTLLALHATGSWSSDILRFALGFALGGEIVVVTLVALNLSATAVSREREDGTLDIILTTPIQPGPYIAGKCRGLVQFLLPMMLVPIGTLAAAVIYVAARGAGDAVSVTDTASWGTETHTHPLAMWPGALALPIMLVPFIAFCVMVGLHWSIRSRGMIGSVIGAVGVLLGTVGVLGLCAFPMAQGTSFFGSILSAMSPVNLVMAILYPSLTIPSAMVNGPMVGQVSVLVGAIIAGIVYTALARGLYAGMKRSFMTTVRRLAGAG